MSVVFALRNFAVLIRNCVHFRNRSCIGILCCRADLRVLRGPIKCFRPLQIRPAAVKGVVTRLGWLATLAVPLVLAITCWSRALVADRSPPGREAGSERAGLSGSGGWRWAVRFRDPIADHPVPDSVSAQL